MRIGIDLGGTKIEGIVMGPGGAEIARLRVATPQGAYAATIETVRTLVSELEASIEKTCSVGVAMPGAISSKTGLIKNANSTWLNGKPFDKDLSAALGREVRLANDANCFALSEATDGAGAGRRVVFGVILGTGCGGGIVVDGDILEGAHAIGGEWGHNPLPWPDGHEIEIAPACYCGKRGCLETWISGPGFSADYNRETGQSGSAAEIANLVAEGDAAAKAALSRLVDRIARGLASVINIIDPDIIVLGGGLSHIIALYDLIPACLPSYVFSDHIDMPVVRNRHGASSGVRGAAWLWPERAS